jgi:hypothetical protein
MIPVRAGRRLAALSERAHSRAGKREVGPQRGGLCGVALEVSSPSFLAIVKDGPLVGGMFQLVLLCCFFGSGST